MSTFVLKLIACITMLIDHLALVFLDAPLLTQLDFANADSGLIVQSVFYTLGRGIGRIAFPIFCFLVVEGLAHTKNLKKYFLRLAIAAVIAEIPFDMMVFGAFFEFGGQNVIWTLLLGLAAVAVIDSVKKKYPGDVFKYNTFSCLAILVFGSLAMLIASDYSVYGVLLIVSVYMLREKKLWMLLMFLVLTWLFYSSSLLLEFAAVLAFPLIFLYNGKKGIDDKHLFYAFYPAHMLILGLLVCFVL